APNRKRDPTDREEYEDDVIIVEGERTVRNFKFKKKYASIQEGVRSVPLGRMKNAQVLPLCWEDQDFSDKRVLVFGGDEFCIQQLQARGAKSVRVYRRFESPGQIGNLLALADVFQIDRPPNYPVMKDGVAWPSWTNLDAISMDEGDS
ncbi:hypothetical protein PENTCL1PPCAC_27940, partial [Pristionchus entomophagus]